MNAVRPPLPLRLRPEGPPISLRLALRGSTAVLALAALAASPSPANAQPYAPPVVVFNTGPAEGERTNTNDDLEFTFAGTADDGVIAAYTCTLDGKPLEGCWESVWLDDLADGEHVLSVTATDERDVTSTPAVRRFTVDATAPAPAVTSPSGTLASGPLTITGTAGTAFGDVDEVLVVVAPFVPGMQHSMEPVFEQTVPVVDGAWSVTTPPVPAGLYGVGALQQDDVGNFGSDVREITLVAPAVPVTPAPGPATTAPAPAAPAKPAPAPAKPAAPKTALAQTARGLTQTLSQGGIDGLLKKPTTVASFQAPGAGTVTVQLLAPRAKGAAAKRAKAKPVVVATGTKTVGAAGPAAVRVTLTKAGRAALKKGKRLSLTVATSFTAKGAKTAQTSSGTVTLKRR